MDAQRLVVCADLCEEHGFIEQASLLRRLASGDLLDVFAVVRGGSEPVMLFHDRGPAEAEVDRRHRVAGDYVLRSGLYAVVETTLST